MRQRPILTVPLNGNLDTANVVTELSAGDYADDTFQVIGYLVTYTSTAAGYPPHADRFFDTVEDAMTSALQDAAWGVQVTERVW